MKKANRHLSLALAGMLAVNVGWCPSGIAEAQDWHAVDIRHVEVHGEIGRRIELTVNNNLLVLDVDEQFLKPIREKDDTPTYVGLGKLIDSFVRFAAHTGRADVRAKKDKLIADTLALQEEDGYLGMFPPDKRMWTLWDVHEMAYLITGLVSEYEFFGNETALAAARRIADYIIDAWTRNPQGDPSEGITTVFMAHTGLETALLALTDATHDGRYRDFCVKNRRLAQWDTPIVLGRWGRIAGHAYAYLNRCLAQLRLYEHNPDEELLLQSRRVIDFITRENGMVITGACGDHECWHNTQAGTHNLGETCASAYMIRLCNQLTQMKSEARYGDLMERVIYNTLFAAQSPNGRRIRYYTPFDGPRAYFARDCYCCPNNYRRILADLPGMIYYAGTNGIVVNLYAASTATIPVKKVGPVTIRQETRYPTDGRVVIHVDPPKPATFTLTCRVPAWVRRMYRQIGSGPIEGLQPGSRSHYTALQRRWSPGDTLTLNMDMPVRLIKGRVNQLGRAAVMRGPQVFCLNPDHPPNKAVQGKDLRTLTIDPASLAGPVPDPTVRPDGVACTIEVWPPDAYYPHSSKRIPVTLTEFPDPGGQAIYFNLPNPNDENLFCDELLTPP